MIRNIDGLRSSLMLPDRVSSEERNFGNSFTLINICIDCDKIPINVLVTIMNNGFGSKPYQRHFSKEQKDEKCNR